MANYHHTVTENATPFGEFTKWCRAGDNSSVIETKQIRRANLKRLIDERYRGNQSALARACGKRPSYFSDLLNVPDKSFGERAARKIEAAAGLVAGQLDVPESPLLPDESRRDRVKDEVFAMLDELSREDHLELLPEIRRRWLKRQRKAS